MKGVFITGTDTGVGKTYFTTLLTRTLRKQGIPAIALKPVACGDRSDATTLSEAMDGALPVQKINPIHFATHLSPYAASRMENLRELSQTFWQHPNVGDVRQEGTILAVEIVAERSSRKPFPAEERRGARICQAAKQFGLLTRPIGDVLILMPPYSTTSDELEQMVSALQKALAKEIPA